MKRYKFPRIMHLPWSPGTTSDDRLLESVDHFKGMHVIVTEKLDGEGTTWYNDHQHARSMDSQQHPSRTWQQSVHGAIKHLIPDGCRLLGENVYAQHSILYQELSSYFYLFGVAIGYNYLSWDRVKNWCTTLNESLPDNMKIDLPPVLYEGVWDEAKIKACYTKKSAFYAPQEGYVVRNVENFPATQEGFNSNVAKFVRKGHVQTDQFWMHKPVNPNWLKSAGTREQYEKESEERYK